MDPSSNHRKTNKALIPLWENQRTAETHLKEREGERKKEEEKEEEKKKEEGEEEEEGERGREGRRGGEREGERERELSTTHCLLLSTNRPNQKEGICV